MKNIVILGLLFIILSCRSTHINKDNYLLNNNKIIISYKQRVFFECLKASFENDSIFELIRKEDFFDSSDFFTFQMVDKARALGKGKAINIPEYESHCDDCSRIKKKTIMSSCLNYYMSKELDSIAKIECKNYLE